jgi:hypothetical protein
MPLSFGGIAPWSALLCVAARYLHDRHRPLQTFMNNPGYGVIANR